MTSLKATITNLFNRCQLLHTVPTTSDLLVCFKAQPIIQNQLMGDLPEARLRPVRPFYNTAVDYAGPFLIKDGKLRNRKLIKAYLCVFVCFVTKAVHLELTTELSASSFLQILNRFVARRGLPKTLYSDNGTNFVGANNELKAIKGDLQRLAKDDIWLNYLLENNIVALYAGQVTTHGWAA